MMLKLKSIKLLLISSLIILLFNCNIYASNDPVTSAACRVAVRNGQSAIQVAQNLIYTIYNIFPVKIGAVTISGPGPAEDTSGGSDNVPVCYCIMPPPVYYKVGVRASFWEPTAVIEVTQLPMCSPAIGTDLVYPAVGAFSLSENSSSAGGNAASMNSYQSHYLKYPIFQILEIFVDAMCTSGNDGTSYYPSELDPMFQNDIWSATIHPETYLVANPIAQLACIPDAVASSLGFPLDPLWWCFGSWGSAFPLTKNVEATTNVTASAASVARLLFKLHRQGQLWGQPTDGQGLCSKVVMPIMRKSHYGIFPVYPVGFPYRIPIGRTGLLWSWGQDVPGNQNVWAWAIYTKRYCCFT